MCFCTQHLNIKKGNPICFVFDFSGLNKQSIADLSVLSLAANTKGSLLATGDSTGHISIWNISDFATSKIGTAALGESLLS